MLPDEHLRQNDKQGNLPCRLANRRLDELQAHPSYVRHQLSVSASQVSALVELGSLAFQQPIVISRDGIVVDGYARWELARRQGKQTILCLEYELTEEEALQWLIQSHRPLRGLNSYCRARLALDLALPLKQAGQLNQRHGGQHKGSSKLTEAQKVDVRAKTAITAGISSGNIAKVGQICASGHPNVQEALRSGEIKIHRAWQWSRLSPQKQLAKLDDYQSQKGTDQTIRRLIQKHVERLTPSKLIPQTLNELLKPLLTGRSVALDSIAVSEIDARGKIAYFTKDAMASLKKAEMCT